MLARSGTVGTSLLITLHRETFEPAEIGCSYPPCLSIEPQRQVRMRMGDDLVVLCVNKQVHNKPLMLSISRTSREIASMV